jgi:hypothetical protein
MAELKMWEFTDNQVSEAITYCHDRFVNSTSVEDAKEWKEIETMFLREQRERMDLMLKDETEASKISYEDSRFEKNLELEEKKLKTSKVLKVGEIAVGLVGSAATIISAVLNFSSRRIEFETKRESWERICQYEESGEIPLQQSNKFIKL